MCQRPFVTLKTGPVIFQAFHDSSVVPWNVLVNRQFRFLSLALCDLKDRKLKAVLSCLPFSYHFEVKAKYDANNLAYTSNFLPLHIDLPYYDYIPGVSGIFR